MQGAEHPAYFYFKDEQCGQLIEYRQKNNPFPGPRFRRRAPAVRARYFRYFGSGADLSFASPLAPIVYAVAVMGLFALGGGWPRSPGVTWARTTTPALSGTKSSVTWSRCFSCRRDGCGWLRDFFLFRLFDIWKPYPIRLIDQRLSNGFGCLLDDVLAGVYALLVLQAARLALG